MKIVAAAIRGPNNKIYIGRGHAECLIQEPIGVLRGCLQGFITDTEIFVCRRTALFQFLSYVGKHVSKCMGSH